MRTDFNAEWSLLSNVIITTNAAKQLGIPKEEALGSENRVPIHWSVFLIAGATTLLLAVITVVIRSWITAKMNPAESLKNE